jgi:tetratricopeptide (TPR) repeat protein
MMTSWDEIRGKIKRAHDEVESAYEKHVVSAVDKVKERPLLNTAVKISLSAIPIIGPNLRDLYDSIGGGAKKSEEDKTKEILNFLENLEQQNKQQFDRITEDLKSNSQAIIDAINQNKIDLSALIKNSWKEIVDALHSLQKTADVTLDKVDAIAGGVERLQQSILEQRPSPSSEFKRPPKPSTFLGESAKIFVGRKKDIDTVRNYFVESNLPVSITGEGGIGKSELAYKAMHKCEDMFDLIIPVYFGSYLTFESFLLEMAKSLRLPMSIDKFEQLDNVKEKAEIIKDALVVYKRALIYADNYETIAGVLRINDGLAPYSASTKEREEEIDDARKINAFLENLPSNTAVLLTSRERYNLDAERPVRLDGLSETEGRDLFIELAKSHFSRRGEPSAKVKKALEELSKKAGGHPLSIELLARSYRGEGLSEVKEMLKHMGVGVVNPKEASERLQSLESCFEYSFNSLPQTYKDLLHKLTLFDSPFPADAIEKIFGFGGSFKILLDLYDRSLLRRIEFEEHDNDGVNGTYRLYYFHPAIRNYLEHSIEANEQDLEAKYGDQFSQYYSKLLEQTYNAIGAKDHLLTLERFNLIWQGKANDFDRAIRLAKHLSVASSISTYLGLILEDLGLYNESLGHHKKALSIDEELKDKMAIAADHANIGLVLYHQGNYDSALDYLRKALAIHEELQDKVGIARDYNNIGISLVSQGNYNEALSCHRHVLAIHEDLNDRVGIAIDYYNIAFVLRRQGNYQEALEYHKKALAIHEELNNRVGMAANYVDIGDLLRKQGNNNQALDYLRKALAIHEELHYKVRMAKDYVLIGSTLGEMTDYQRGLEYVKKALAIHEELNDTVGMAVDYSNLGVILHKQGNYQEALAYHNKCLQIVENLNDRVRMAKEYSGIAILISYYDKPEQALDYLNKALAIHEDLGDRVEIATDYNIFAVIHNGQGNYQEALEYHKKALAIHEKLNNRVRIAVDYAGIGAALANIKNRRIEALESFSKGLKILQDIEENTGYHHPHIDLIQGYILRLQEEKENGVKLE